MDLTWNAELAVALVNTVGDNGTDRLATMHGLRDLLADHGSLVSRRVSHLDLEALRALRGELAGVFAASAAGDGGQAVSRLNGLLAQHPCHPEIVQHDREGWHLHLAESGSVADTYAAGAVVGLATLVTERGIDRIGVCEAPSCRAVYADADPGGPGRYCASHAPAVAT